MKRLVAIVVMMVLMVSAVWGAAETEKRSDLAEMYKEYCEKLLESLCDLYDKYGDKIDDDYVELTYDYYQLWIALKNVYGKELQFNIKDLVGSSKVFGIDKNVSYAWTELNMLIEERWTKYINGETDKAEFMGTLTGFIRAQIEAGKEAEKEAEKRLNQ